ncbi:Hsp20/alpha crystallin family protein [Pseudonocardiaceae bacterium YIM PH 21723]|nr:Hsp20/alpha crystallin family protein [Pseudonocardiaceae bacterium YIM PH 21723]
MTLAVRGTLWDPFTSFAAEFDSLARRARVQENAYVPAVNVTREGGDALITLELPGVDVDNDVDIEVTQGRLTISGNRAEQTTQEDQGWKVREIRSGKFSREFTLPDHVGAEQIEADYDKGLLRIRVKDVAKPEVAAAKVPIRHELTR